MKQLNVSLYLMSDGDRTVAEACMIAGNPAVYGKGSSGREPGDKNDAQTGEDLAVARALRSMAAHLERRANGRMRHIESVKAHRQEIAAGKADARNDPDAPRSASWLWDWNVSRWNASSL